MKRAGLIVLTLYYLSGAIGLQFNVHYCHGQFESIKIGSNQTICCCTDNPSIGACCGDEAYVFQIDKDQQTPSQFLLKEIVLFTSTYQSLPYKRILLSVKSLFYKPDVPKHPIPIWLLYNSPIHYA